MENVQKTWLFLSIFQKGNHLGVTIALKKQSRIGLNCIFVQLIFSFS